MATSTRPPATPRSCTAPPGTLTFRQLAPSSLVCQSAGPNAHPAPPPANRIEPTAFAGGLPWYKSAGGASGAATLDQSLPPFTVRRISTVRQVWTWSAHGVASSHPADAETKLTDSTLSVPPPPAGEPASEPARATVSLAALGAGLLPPCAGLGAARPHPPAATSSAAAVTKTRHDPSARPARRAVPEPTPVPIIPDTRRSVRCAPRGPPTALTP